MAKVCPYCGSSDLTEDKKNNVFLCNNKKCGKGFPQPKEGGAQCPFCNQRLTVFHEENKVFECKNCNKWFKPGFSVEKEGTARGMKWLFRKGKATTPAPEKTEKAKLPKAAWQKFLIFALFLIAIAISFVPLPVTFPYTVKLAVLIGIVMIGYILGSKGLSVLAVILILAVIFLQTEFGQSALEQAGIKEAIDEASLSVKYTSCYLTNVFNVNVLQAGNLQGICYDQVYGFKAKKEGCKECVDFTPTQRSYGVPLRPQIIELSISLAENSNGPAKNIVAKVVDAETGREAETTNNKCTDEKPCDLKPGDDPALVRAALPLPCKNSIDYKGIVSYKYVVQGQSEIRVKEAGSPIRKMSQENVNGISSSGPMGFGIRSDSMEYSAGEDYDIYINFYLYNEGRGTVKPISTTVTQIPPADGEELKLLECAGINSKVTPIDDTKFVIEEYGSIPSTQGDIVTCHFSVPSTIKAPYLTYKFIGVSEYNYRFEKKDSILIDLLNYPCTLISSHWRVYTGTPKPINNTQWYEESFNDESWGFVDLPDKDWTDSDKYYRKTIIKATDQPIWLNVSSDDGTRCYVNGNLAFDDLGSQHDHGKACCKPICQREEIRGPIGCDPWDYRVEITNRLKDGINVVACQVHNVWGKGWFEIAS